MSGTTQIDVQETTTATLLAEHEADKARRQKRHDANREELLKCLNPLYAAQKELEKPVYRWSVSAKWRAKNQDGVLTEYSSEQTVIAQNESDAWAQFCDKLAVFPSRRDAKPVIKQLEKVKGSMLSVDGDENTELDRVTIPAIKGKRKKPKQKLS